MAKKGKKVDRASGSAGADRAGRWTVRGVAAGLQKAAGDAARARDLTLGQWLTEVVEDALGGAGARPSAAAGWSEAIERRLDRLERAVFDRQDAPADRPTAEPAPAA